MKLLSVLIAIGTISAGGSWKKGSNRGGSWNWYGNPKHLSYGSGVQQGSWQPVAWNGWNWAGHSWGPAWNWSYNPTWSWGVQSGNDLGDILEIVILMVENGPLVGIKTTLILGVILEIVILMVMIKEVLGN